MPAAGMAAPTIRPRWPQASFPMNGTSSSTKPPKNNIPDAEEQKTPSSVPQPSYSAVTVAPAGQLPPPPTPQASIPTYAGSGAALLKDYCTDPAFTLLDGPTAVWVPVIGCISTKTDCCATPTTDGGAGQNAPKTTGGSGGKAGGGVGGAGGGAQFPIAMLPSQGTLTGCPEDYHTVGGTACCPSSYWLWTTEIGGQVPCYSSLSANLKPPPIPDTLANAGRMTREGSGSITTPASVPATALTLNQKPTSAIVNIAYAMQYPMVPKADPGLSKGGKIGVGVGSASAVALIGVLIWFLIRKFFAHKKTKGELTETSVSQRFGSQIDMSRVAHEPAGVARTHDGVKYQGVATRPMNF